MAGADDKMLFTTVFVISKAVSADPLPFDSIVIAMFPLAHSRFSVFAVLLVKLNVEWKRLSFGEGEEAALLYRGAEVHSLHD